MKATVSCAIFKVENLLPGVGFLQASNLKPPRGIAEVPPLKVTSIRINEDSKASLKLISLRAENLGVFIADSIKVALEIRNYAQPSFCVSLKQIISASSVCSNAQLPITNAQSNLKHDSCQLYNPDFSSLKRRICLSWAKLFWCI